MLSLLGTSGCVQACPHTADGMLRLQNVRVVQRNLVYVVGLALELCYEDLLKTDKYFGQFGKIIKVRRPFHTWAWQHPVASRARSLSMPFRWHLMLIV